MKPDELARMCKPGDEVILDTPMMRMRGKLISLKDGYAVIKKGRWTSARDGDETGTAYLKAGTIRSVIVVDPKEQ